VSQITTLLELRKRAEFFTGKMHGGSMMVCDAHTLLACLDSLADELEVKATAYEGRGGVYMDGACDGYRGVAKLLRGKDVIL
jgi:hypothetical protein